LEGARAARTRLESDAKALSKRLREFENSAAGISELKTELATAQHLKELAEKELSDLSTLSRWWQTELQRARSQAEEMALELQQLRPENDHRSKFRI
jgi:hypothetical protein